MSSCFTGGGRAYRLDIDIIKSPSTSWASNSSSPSSTLSESSNSPLAISTRKPRTPRKRPNQTYNEAAAILSTAYPKIFPTKHLTKNGKFSTNNHPLLFEPSDLLMIPFQIIDTSVYLLNHPTSQIPNFVIDQKKFLNSSEKRCQSPGEISSQVNLSENCDDFNRECQDFDAESILDEEVEEGIDSIMGNLSVDSEKNDDSKTDGFVNSNSTQVNSFCYGYPVGLGFDFGYGMRKEVGAMRNVDEGDWWRFPCVNVDDINPKISKIASEKKKKKKKVEIKNLYEATNEEKSASIKSSSEEPIVPQPNVGLLLKLNYDDVLKDWSDKASPFSGDGPGSESTGNDVQARLAQIDLFSENGGIREASVQRYKEKRRTRLFSNKIRYEVRKVNADRRPRMKGRFVRTPSSPDTTTDEQE